MKKIMTTLCYMERDGKCEYAHDTDELKFLHTIRIAKTKEQAHL